MEEQLNDPFIESLMKEKQKMLALHTESLKALIDKKGESIYSSVLDRNGEPTVSPSSLTDVKRLNTRYDYFMLCMQALDHEEELQENAGILEENKLRNDLLRLKRELTLYEFHYETLKALYEKKQSKIGLDVTESLATEEAINERIDYFHIFNEILDTNLAISAKKARIDSYDEHVQRTAGEIRKIEDAEMDELIEKLETTKFEAKDKAKAVEYLNKYKAGNIMGLVNRFDFFKGVNNFLAQRA